MCWLGLQWNWNYIHNLTPFKNLNWTYYMVSLVTRTNCIYINYSLNRLDSISRPFLSDGRRLRILLTDSAEISDLVHVKIWIIFRCVSICERRKNQGPWKAFYEPFAWTSNIPRHAKARQVRMCAWKGLHENFCRRGFDGPWPIIGGRKKKPSFGRYVSCLLYTSRCV